MSKQATLVLRLACVWNAITLFTTSIVVFRWGSGIGKYLFSYLLIIFMFRNKSLVPSSKIDTLGGGFKWSSVRLLNENSNRTNETLIEPSAVSFHFCSRFNTWNKNFFLYITIVNWKFKFPEKNKKSFVSFSFFVILVEFWKKADRCVRNTTISAEQQKEFN